MKSPQILIHKGAGVNTVTFQGRLRDLNQMDRVTKGIVRRAVVKHFKRIQGKSK